VITTTEPIQQSAPYTVEPAAYGDSQIGVCSTCGDRTRKLGSARKATSAIVDHIRAKHPETMG
jgi:hypothetical protein